MPQHSYKQLEEAYQKGVNKEHKPNPARTHPKSSRQGKGCLEMPVNQTKPAQYSQDSQSDSDHDFKVTAVKPNAESTRLDGIHSCPQDSHVPHHMRQTSFSQNHQISMMKRGSTDHHTPSQDCSNCGQLGHPWFTCPRIVCHRCSQYSHILSHCWDRIPPSGTVSSPEGQHNNGK